jgi:hypothetical protein
MKDEFYNIAFRKKIYHTLEELQRDVDEWLVIHNHQRSHSERYCYGKNPMQTFSESKRLAEAKMLDRQQALAGQPDARTAVSKLFNVVSSRDFYTSAKLQIGRFFDDVYCAKRIHSSLGYLTPAAVRGSVVQAVVVTYTFKQHFRVQFYGTISDQLTKIYEVISKFIKALKHSVQVVLDEKDSDECAI